MIRKRGQVCLPEAPEEPGTIMHCRRIMHCSGQCQGQSLECTVSSEVLACSGGCVPRTPLMSCVVCRLVSGNSIEEKLLKNGTKDLIREVAAQGNDYSMAFLTQVC